MAEPRIYYDLEFHFSSGRNASFTLLEGQDAINDEPEWYRVTRQNEDGSETTLTVHKNKLDAVESTKRAERQPPTLEELMQAAKSSKDNVLAVEPTLSATDPHASADCWAKVPK